eukprot:335137_1
MSINSNDVKPCKMRLSDIIVPVKKAKKNVALTMVNSASSSTLSAPSVILDDWLYLGNRYHAKSRDMLEQLKITHVLNITATIPCSFPDIIQYAHIKVFDESTVKLYDYFEAAADFIDLCNPLNYDINKEPNKRKRRVLVHCAMGISRSATITISYLMSRAFVFNKTERKIISHIQEKMESFDNHIESKIKEKHFDGTGFSKKMFEDHKNNKDLTKRIRKKYQKSNGILNSNGEDVKKTNGEYQALPLSFNEEKSYTNHGEEDTKFDEINIMKINDEICVGLLLGEAYLFCLERRNVVCPNVGFCRQLEAWEKYVWDNNDSTLYHIPFFRPNLDETEVNKNTTQNNGDYYANNKRNNYDHEDQQYECEQCCIVL